MLTAILAHSSVLKYINFNFLWYPLYGISFIIIFNKIKKSSFFEPVVIVPFAYLFLIVIGTLIFEKIKGSSYDVYPLNLAGMGYSSLFIGILLTQNIHLKFTHYKNHFKNNFNHSMRNKLIICFLIILAHLFFYVNMIYTIILVILNVTII